MHPSRRVAISVGIVGLVIAALLSSGSALDTRVPQRAVKLNVRHSTLAGVTLPYEDVDTVEARDRVARDAALAELTAQQAQDLADQLQRAAQRLQTAPSPPPAPVPVSVGPAPCPAPTIPLGWIAWCESGCNPLSRNNSSSAAGKYQYLTTTWNDYGGYPTADAAPEYAQDQRAASDTAGGNYSPWNSSRGCWGGKF